MSFIPGVKVVFRYRGNLIDNRIQIDVVVTDEDGNDLIIVAEDVRMEVGAEIAVGPVRIEVCGGE